MSGIYCLGLVGCLIAYQLLCTFVARHETRRFDRSAGPDSTDPKWSRGLSEQAPAVSVKDDATFQVIKAATPTDTTSWKGYREMLVNSIVDESPDCRSFTLTACDGDPLPRFQSGQSILVRLQHPETNKNVSRCYSLSSGPGEDAYRITVKRVPGGVMSNLLHDHVMAGDRIGIQSPRGKFHLNTEQPERPVSLIAAGIGITPMLSMLLHSLEVSPERRVDLFYQLRDSSNAPFLDSLRYLAGVCPSFHLHVWFSKGEGTDFEQGVLPGRMNASEVLSRRGRLDGDFMICGPAQFMSQTAVDLVDGGVDASCVAYESFGPAAKGVGAIQVDGDSGDTAATNSEQSASPSAASVSPCNVRFEQSDQTARWDSPNDSLLDVAEAADVEVDSGCRSGDCGACVVRLLRGEVTYPTEPSCDFEGDEVVLCAAQPNSDIEIEA